MYHFFEKIDVFNNIEFTEKFHKYTIDGVPTVSVTKVTGSVRAPFDAAAMAPLSVAKYNREHGTNITAEELQAIWGAKNLIAQEKGTAFHKVMEAAMANKVEFYPEEHMVSVFTNPERLSSKKVFLPDNVKQLFGNMSVAEFFRMPAVMNEFGPVLDLMKKNHKIVTGHGKAFLNDIRGKMYPVKSEVVIGSPKYLVCGCVDQIFFNIKSQQFEIWDWKTNSEFDYDDNECKYSLIDSCAHLKATKLNEYSLQLACYKQMFQEMTGIPIGNCYLCWFSELQPTYKVFKCKDLSAEANVLLTTRGGRKLV